MIARVCPATLEDVRGEILTADWSHVLKEVEMKIKVVAALASTRDTLHPQLKAAEKAAGARLVRSSLPNVALVRFVAAKDFVMADGSMAT